jgi:hypothetical protein
VEGHMSKKRRVSAEDFTCTIVNPELLENNINFSKAVVNIFCKNLSAKQLDEVIKRIECLDESCTLN